MMDFNRSVASRSDLSSDCCESLELRLYDHDLVSSDDLLGKVIITPHKMSQLLGDQDAAEQTFDIKIGGLGRSQGTVTILVELVNLSFTVLKGLKLIAADWTGYADPFCRVFYGGKYQGKTKVCKKTLDPVWKAPTFYFRFRSSATLLVELWDWDRTGEADFMGAFVVSGDDISGGLLFSGRRVDQRAGEVTVARALVDHPENASTSPTYKDRGRLSCFFRSLVAIEKPLDLSVKLMRDNLLSKAAVRSYSTKALTDQPVENTPGKVGRVMEKTRDLAVAKAAQKGKSARNLVTPFTDPDPYRNPDRANKPGISRNNSAASKQNEGQSTEVLALADVNDEELSHVQAPEPVILLPTLVVSRKKSWKESSRMCCIS
jgi:hypothetical protein